MTIRSIESAIMRAIPQDKCLHIIAGVMLFAATHPFGAQVALIAVFGAAVAKETLDHFTGGDVSLWDIVATCAGGALGLLCSLA